MPSESAVPAEEKLTTSGSSPLVGVPAAAAVGAALGSMVIVAVDAVTTAPELSVTVRVGV